MVQLRPVGPVVVVNLESMSGIPGTGTFGPPPQWADDSDTSKARIGASFDLGNDVGTDTLPDANVDPGAVTGLSVTARLQIIMAEDDPSPDVSLNLYAPGMGTTLLGDFLGSATIATPPPAGPTDIDMSFGPLLIDLGFDAVNYAREVATWLAGGPRPIYITVAGTYSPGVVLLADIYELTVTLDAVVATARRTVHPCRRYPRDDGAGMSAAPRIYPPPRVGRLYGGHG